MIVAELSIHQGLSNILLDEAPRGEDTQEDHAT